MKFTYKVVSLEGFLANEKELKTFSNSFEEAANGAAQAVEILINHYAEDGWEYVRSENFDAAFFKSTGAAIFDGLFKSAATPSGPRPVFIFRKVMSIDEEMEITRKNQLRVDNFKTEAISKGMSRDEADASDAKCPSCESLVKSSAKECWKCKADFGQYSSWRPIKL